MSSISVELILLLSFFLIIHASFKSLPKSDIELDLSIFLHSSTHCKISTKASFFVLFSLLVKDFAIFDASLCFCQYKLTLNFYLIYLYLNYL